METEKSTGGVCHFFLRGHCKFGKQCRNIHDIHSSKNIGDDIVSIIIADFSEQLQWEISSYGLTSQESIISEDISPEELRHNYYKLKNIVTHGLYYREHLILAHKAKQVLVKTLSTSLPSPRLREFAKVYDEKIEAVMTQIKLKFGNVFQDYR
eukprot:TRINITY_DN7919_c0_g1_i1.p1 TRINITY_DN7919_c0_g1~~TRINITY_DN7919_c0_g1_i1.p1  ORF type:complete len:166 (-),score=28.64 TRINITY_DN7919_c0_g1_i1:60-518(-)